MSRFPAWPDRSAGLPVSVSASSTAKSCSNIIDAWNVSASTYSDVAITQAEDALQLLLANLDALCQRDDACQMISELLRRIDIVTKLSAWTEPHQVH